MRELVGLGTVVELAQPQQLDLQPQTLDFLGIALPLQLLPLAGGLLTLSGGLDALALQVGDDRLEHLGIVRQGECGGVFHDEDSYARP